MNFLKKFAINLAGMFGILAAASLGIFALNLFMAWVAANFPKSGEYVFAGTIVGFIGIAVAALKSAYEVDCDKEKVNE